MASTYHMMRNFISVMRSLGYPRLMSMENFRNPNFPLMADVLVYLLKRFDPTTDIEVNVGNEQERLRFVMLASHLMVNKANLDINVKKLYMADVNSIQEMIKLAKLIQDAWISVDRKDNNNRNNNVINEVEDENNEGEDINNESATGLDTIVDQASLSQFNTFKTSQITSDIYQVATKLYDAIIEHDQNKDQLQKTLSKQLNIDQLESSIRQSIQLLQQEIFDMQTKKQTLDMDNEDLNSKIEKKQAELNRNKKRLQTLYSQRPGYMDELEKIEQDIVGLYDQFVTNSRCLSFLEQKLEEFEELERLKIEERNKEIKQMLEQIKIDDFLKNNKEMRLNSWNNQNIDERSSNDELAMMVDLDEDALGRVSGSDFSDKDINEIPRNTESRRERQKTNPNQHNNSRSGKKERLLMANTVTVKSQRSPVNNITTNEIKQNETSTTNRSARTAKIFSYGSLLENGDDDDDDDDDDDSKSEANANKMSDSEIDLDAIESEEDEDSINSTEMYLKSDEKKIPNRKLQPQGGGINISNLNYDNNKIDDNF